MREMPVIHPESIVKICAMPVYPPIHHSHNLKIARRVPVIKTSKQEELCVVFKLLRLVAGQWLVRREIFYNVYKFIRNVAGG